jgi:8-amino-3,8-dideoxy-alpha-D-manno-octulosonate transaminase
MPGYEVIGEEERFEVQDVFDKGGVLFRHGFDGIRNGCYKVQEFERRFAKHMDVPYALAVSSGTAALRVALAALGIRPGDEVITQSFTFVATVEAIIESGATPICVEIDETLNMDPGSIKKHLSEKTKAIIPVHMLGSPARIAEISAFCREHGLALLEDTAWGCGGDFQSQKLGTWGDVGAFSFDFAKTMTTGEGGMLTFHDETLYRKAAAWHDHGHENNPCVPRWEDTRTSGGFNYRMMELQAAVGLAQLEKLPLIISAHRQNHLKLWQAIEDIPGVWPRVSPIPGNGTADALVFFVQDQDRAKKCREELLKVNINTKILPEAITWHFAGMWEHLPQLRPGSSNAFYPISSDLLSRSVSIPIGVKLPEDLCTRLRTAVLRALGL